MGRAKTSIRILLTCEERTQLHQTAHANSAPYRDVVRSRLILLVADGHSISSVSQHVGYPRHRVRFWANRFLEKRLIGLQDAPRCGRPARFPPSGHYASC